MITIERKEIKQEFQILIEGIKRQHRMEYRKVYYELFEKQKPKEGAVHTRGYFLRFKGYYVQYLLDHFIMNPTTQTVGVNLQRLIIYDSFIEFEAAKIKALSAVKPWDQSGLNLN